MVPSDLFEVYDIDLSTVPVPKDLERWRERLSASTRFDDPEFYPPGVIKSDNFTHTQVVSLMACRVVKEEQRRRAEALAIVHDVPESNPGKDVTLMARHYDPRLDAVKRRQEDEFIARYLRDEPWLSLFKEYRLASEFVHGADCLSQVSYVALVVKVIDRIEGFITLHRSITTFVRSPDYTQEKIPADRVLRLGLEKNQTLYQRLREGSHEATPLCLSLLDAATDYVRRLWRSCPIDRIPYAICDYFEWE